MAETKHTAGDLEKLRAAAHEAPMNKVFQDHDGHRFLGSHSMAWAKASREWMEACAKAEGSSHA
jgi:hypothetical protein